MNNTPFITPARVLFALTFFTWFITELYEVREISLPFSFELISRLGIAWTVWWWLRNDSRRLGIGWILDLGFFLYLAWPFILPYHLFKTRGLKAFIPILAFILTALCGSLTAVIFSNLLF